MLQRPPAQPMRSRRPPASPQPPLPKLSLSPRLPITRRRGYRNWNSSLSCTTRACFPMVTTRQPRDAFSSKCSRGERPDRRNPDQSRRRGQVIRVGRGDLLPPAAGSAGRCRKTESVQPGLPVAAVVCEVLPDHLRETSIRRPAYPNRLGPAVIRPAQHPRLLLIGRG
jgi:hypothetical protein